MASKPLPPAIRSYVEKIGLTWDIECHVTTNTGVWPTVRPDVTNRQHVIKVRSDVYFKAYTSEVVGIWLDILGHLLLAETRDPVFSDNANQTEMVTDEYAWPIEAVTTVWAFDELYRFLSPELLILDVLPGMFGHLCREFPGLIRETKRKQRRLGIHGSLAKCYGICLRADRHFRLQNTFASTVSQFFNRQKRLAKPDCNMTELGNFFCDLPVLMTERNEACQQLAKSVTALQTLLKLPVSLILNQKPTRSWWQL